MALPQTGSVDVPAANGTMAAPISSNGNNMAPNDSNSNTTQALDADEIALYDRQIRLWGAQAQERIRSAHILLISIRALGTEIAKNLTLAGISSLTIVDDGIVSEEDLGAQFFLRQEDIGKPRVEAALPRIQELNPRVTVKAGPTLQEINEDFSVTIFSPYSCVIACDQNYDTLTALNLRARLSEKPFYAAGIHGLYGFIFADLISHDFVVEREKPNVATKPDTQESLTRSVISATSKKESGPGGGAGGGKPMEIVQKREIYCPLMLANTSALPREIAANRRKARAVPPLVSCLRALFAFQEQQQRDSSGAVVGGGKDFPDHTASSLATFATLAKQQASSLKLPNDNISGEFMRSFLQSLGSEISPTAAFVGGRLSEDVINVLGKREQPIQNFAFFDGESLEGKVYCLFTTPPPPQGDQLQGQQQQQAGLNGFGAMDPMQAMQGADMALPMMDSSMLMNLDGTIAAGFPIGYPNMDMMNGMAGANGMGMMDGGMGMAYGLDANGLPAMNGMDAFAGIPPAADFAAYGAGQVPDAGVAMPQQQQQQPQAAMASISAEGDSQQQQQPKEQPQTQQSAGPGASEPQATTASTAEAAPAATNVPTDGPAVAPADDAQKAAAAAEKS